VGKLAGVHNIVEVRNRAVGRIAAEAAHMVVAMNRVDIAAGIVSSRMMEIDTAAQTVARSCLLPSLAKLNYPYEMNQMFSYHTISFLYDSDNLQCNQIRATQRSPQEASSEALH